MLTNFDIGDLVLVKRRMISGTGGWYSWYLHGGVVGHTGSYGPSQWVKVHTEDGKRCDYKTDQMILLASVGKD
jgi:hypothetical protein